MIDTDETGQKKLQAIIAAKDDGSMNWTIWEENFIFDMITWVLPDSPSYHRLTSNQKSKVGDLYDKLIEA